MTTLTLTAALALATTCQSTWSPATIVGIAQHESHLNPAAINKNRDGSLDIGLMQINTANFHRLGLTLETALDPCMSIRAGAQILSAFSGYNTGKPAAGRGYALGVSADIRAVQAETNNPVDIPPEQQDEAEVSDRPSGNNGETFFNGD